MNGSDPFRVAGDLLAARVAPALSPLLRRAGASPETVPGALSYVCEDLARVIGNADQVAPERIVAALTPTPAPKSPPITWAADYADVKAPETIVAGLLEAGTLVVLYGDANCGKSTFALDLSLAVARGESWRGRRTRRGVVLWFALESAAGLRRRVVAYRQRHGLTEAAPLFGDVTAPLRLLDPQDQSAIVGAIQAAESEAGEKCVLVVIDTLARALAGGDENDGRDMSTLIRACDRIRSETGATVVVVHHTGKDSSRGARGHSSLRAAVDTEIEVSGQTNPRQARVTKQRDLPSGEIFPFDLEPVGIGLDRETGDATTACVVVHREDAPANRLPGPAGKAQTLIMRALVNQQRESTDTLFWSLEALRKVGRDLGLHKNSSRDAVISLTAGGFLTPVAGGGYRLSDGAR